jgi:hypothetical protein
MTNKHDCRIEGGMKGGRAQLRATELYFDKERAVHNKLLQARSAGHLFGGSRVATRPVEGGRAPLESLLRLPVFSGGGIVIIIG